MSKVKVLAGDFIKGDGQYTFGSHQLKTEEHMFIGETIPIRNLETVGIASEESVKKIGGTIGWAPQVQ